MLAKLQLADGPAARDFFCNQWLQAKMELNTKEAEYTELEHKLQHITPKVGVIALPFPHDT